MTDAFITWIEGLADGVWPVKKTSVGMVKDYIATTNWGGFIELNDAETHIRKIQK